MRTTQCVPEVSRYSFFKLPDGETVEFRLIYQGPLPPERCEDKGVVGRAKDKHALRKHFHLQLRELWKQHPDLRGQAEQLFTVHTTPFNRISYPGPNVMQVVPVVQGPTGMRPPNSKTWLEHIADDHQRCGGKFVPLVRKAGGFTCALDVLFLRRDSPGNLVTNGGDIDNRIKVLLDGLRMPNTDGEMGGFLIDSDEHPFFCLLEDDRLVSSISVTTDRLVTRMRAEEHIHDVLLVIRVTMVNPSALFAGGRLL